MKYKDNLIEFEVKHDSTKTWKISEQADRSFPESIQVSFTLVAPNISHISDNFPPGY